MINCSRLKNVDVVRMSASVPLSRILQSFSAPISEEHGWGIIYQSCSTLLHLDHDQETLHLVENTGHLLLTDDGTVHPRSFTISENRRRMTSLAQMIAELGVVVYTALDFSLAEEESRSLSEGLEQLIDMMTSADSDLDDTGDQDTDDEGIGEEERGREMIVEKVMSMCCHHLAVSSEAGSHYRAVVRALVAENRELCHFMSRLEDDQLVELDREEWGRIWTHVMEQLRRGVKLKKVNYSRTPVEYSLTPYEMLMDDIRTRKYKLTPVKVPLEVQRGAREVILEFIRSRPPLKSVKHRKVNEKQVEFTPQEQLMNEIRGEEAKSRLKKTNTSERLSESDTGLGRVVNTGDDSPARVETKKKVIDLDESFAENILNFDDNEDEDVVQDDEKDTKLAQFYENNPDISRSNYDQVPQLSNKTPSVQQVQISSPAAAPVKSKYSDWTRNLHKLDLSLAEVSHIRAQLTKAELEDMELSEEKRVEYERGKVCFQCGVVKFGLFTWAVQCQVDTHLSLVKTN